jgi:hypothetical protein
LADRIGVSQQLALQNTEQLLSLSATVRRWVQQRIHIANRYDIPGHLLLRLRDQIPAFVDATD